MIPMEPTISTSGFWGLVEDLVNKWGLTGLAVAVLFVIVLLIVMGRLQPKVMVDARIKDKNLALKMQQDAIDKYGNILTELKDTQDDVLEFARTTTHALESIQHAGQEAGKDK